MCKNVLIRNRKYILITAGEKMTKARTYNFDSISRTRAFLIGISTIWIMAYHSKVMYTFPDTDGFGHLIYVLGYHLYLIKSLGQIGVDIFLFLSAIGLYRSFEKNGDILAFYKRRIKRILPEYLLINFLWELYNRRGVLAGIENICGISLFTRGYRKTWFFILIFFLYLIYPFLHNLYKKYGIKFLSVFLFLNLAFNYAFSVVSPAIFANGEIALRRIPVFLVGLCFGKLIYEKRKGNPYYILAASFLLWIVTYGFLSNEENIPHFAYRYIESIHAICIILVIAYIYDLFANSKLAEGIVKLFEKIGKYSCETYLLYEKLIVILGSALSLNDGVLLATVSAIVCFLLVGPLKRFNDLFN